MLRLIEPYITWGYINKTQIANLVRKRGTCYGENNESMELDNETIERVLGKYNIISQEDIIHEINVPGPHFNEIIKFLGYFLLSPTEEVKEKINIKYAKEGNQGFRGDKINDLLKNMI